MSTTHTSTIFPDASDFQILGGHFSTVGSDSSSFTARDVHVTINHNHPPGTSPSSSSSSSPNPTNVPSAHQRIISSSEDELSQPRPNVTAQTNYDIYRTHLATKGRGLPLWIPEPSQRLPIQYQRQGISLGDVGVVTNAGNFIFLFNIFLPINHPINPTIMPEGFKPLQVTLDNGSVSEQRELKDNSYLASPSRLRTEKKEGSANLVFKSSKLGGAILTIPVGAQREDLICISRLRKYVKANLTNWYRFAYLYRGMEMQNGDLKVVIGCEKTSAWGMACLGLDDIPAVVSDASTDSGDHRFHLEFGPTHSDHRRGGRYAWTYSGEVAEVRAGPDAREVAQLRTPATVGGAGHEDSVEPQEHDPEYFENQCLFLRTMNPVLPEMVWRGLMLEQDSEDDEADSTSEKEETDNDPRRQHKSSEAKCPEGGNQGIGRGDSGQESSSSSRGHDQQASRENSVLNASDSSTAPIVHSMMSLADHPSIAINKFLLKNCSEELTMAISLDQDWMSVVREDDEVFPSSEELLERIMKHCLICEEEGIIFLNSEQQYDVERERSESDHSLTVSSTSSPPRAGVNLEEYTFSAHGPTNDDTNMMTEPDVSNLPSSDYLGYNWSDYTNFNERIYMLHGYPPDMASSLDPFAIQRPRTPPHIFPTGSTPTLSPLYSASPGLASSTPGSTYMPSPVMTDTNNMLVLEPIDNATNGNGSSEHSKLLLNNREQHVQFRDVPLRASDGEFGPFLPQPMYKPHCNSDHKRYVEEVMLEAPIYFKTEHPYQEGILLKDALHSRTKKLVDRDQVAFEGRGPSTFIRLEWPGYRGWSKQIPTKDFRSPPQPITLTKLAKNIAKCIQRFMQDRKAQPMEKDSDPFWKIGDGAHDIKLEDLVLVSLHHVSLGSWQPHLRLVRPSPRHPQQSHGQSMSISRMPPMSLPSINGSSNAVPFSRLNTGEFGI